MIDWQRLALNLRQHGVNCRKADKALGRHVDYVAKIARGEIEEPKFSDGLNLLNLHVDVCGEEKTARLLK